MHHDVAASDAAGTWSDVLVGVGTAVMPGDRLVVLESVVDWPRRTPDEAEPGRGARAPSGVRADLAESIERHAAGLDVSPSRRRRPPPRAGPADTTRENVADLVDDGSFVEYGPLVIAAQRRRPRSGRSHRQHSGGRPGRWHRHGQRRSVRPQAGALHRHVLRLHRARRHTGHAEPPQEGPPVRARRDGSLSRRVLHRGRRRPAGRHRRHRRFGPRDCLAFLYLAELSGLVPLVGVNAGYCFAGNAAILGCCDVVIATLDSNIGMGGPAMIEGGGLGVYEPTAVTGGFNLPSFRRDTMYSHAIATLALTEAYAMTRDRRCGSRPRTRSSSSSRPSTTTAAGATTRRGRTRAPAT